jgi:DNA mismatch repair protein MutS
MKGFDTIRLLYPFPIRETEREPSGEPDPSADLGLEAVATRIASNGIPRDKVRSILRSLVTDPQTIRYRQRVFLDLYEHPQLSAGFESLMPLTEEISYFSSVRREQDSPFFQALMRLGELETYVECVDRLSELLSRKEFRLRSEGLRGLKSFLDTLRKQPGFESLKHELPRIRSGLKLRRSVTIGVNLDEHLRPVEAAILSVNDRPFNQRSLLSRLFSGTNDEYMITTPIHVNPIPLETGIKPRVMMPLAPLFQDLDGILRAHSRQIIQAVERFVRVNTKFIVSFRPEIAFFLGAVRFARELEAAGLPVSLPEILDPEERRLTAEEAYNIHLADRLLRSEPDMAAERIVTNPIRFDDEGRIFILTGPNQGGKTTWTQAVGLLQVMAQAGIFVPAASATVSPVDRIATHFPREEQGALDTGRLSEEAARLQAIFRVVTPNSLVLLNESLSSTSPAEGIVIAEDVIRALRFLGARAVFATHLHELALHCERMNLETEGESRIASLVAVTDHAGTSVSAGSREPAGDGAARRTFRIVPGPPAGRSYARDIAERYGIGFETLTRQLAPRRHEEAGTG